MAVYICPAGNAIAREHYDDTVRRPVDFEQSATLWGSALDQLRVAHPTGEAPMWGSRRGKNDIHVGKHAKMRTGDTVLFYDSGSFYSAATVAVAFINATAGEELWGRTEDGEAWELMFSLNDVTPINLPGIAVNAAVGYAANNVHQGFNRLDDARSEAVLTLLGEEFEPTPSPEALEAALGVLDGPLDKQVSTAARVEQRFLRAALLGGASAVSGECALCGDRFPATMLVAAHIKPRSECTDTEKRDIHNIAMLACAFGCDILFERGYIAVASDGTILRSETKPFANVLTAKVEKSHCTAHSALRGPYFAWHREHRFN